MIYPKIKSSLFSVQVILAYMRASSARALDLKPVPPRQPTNAAVPMLSCILPNMINGGAAVAAKVTLRKVEDPIPTGLFINLKLIDDFLG